MSEINPKPTDQAPELKPREFWIRLHPTSFTNTNHVITDVLNTKSKFDEDVHVIECSAIHQLETQLAQANTLLRDGEAIVQEMILAMGALQTQHATLVEVIGPVLKSFKKMKRNMHRDNWKELRETLLNLETFSAKVGKT